MGSLIAIDPGACAGIAGFFDGELVLLDIEDASELPINVDDVGAAGVIDVVIVERPEVYTKKVGKAAHADPNDLIKLAMRAGALVQAFAPRRVVEVLPKEWKGQAPKEIVARRVLAKLSPVERDTAETELARHHAGLWHNAIDAIGIGLYHLGRYRP